MRRGLVRCALAALLFGASTPVAAVLARDVGPVTLAGLLYLGAALAVAPWVLRHPPDAAGLRRGAGRLAVAVLLGGAVGPVLLMAGLARTPAASASVALNLELPFTVVLAAFVFREHVGRRVASGAVLVTAAGVVVSRGADAGAPRLGVLLVALACAAWAVDNVVTAALDELAPAHVTAAKGLVAGAVNTGVGLAVEGVVAAPSVALALVVGALGYGVSITLWVAGARDLGAARAQVVFATSPFVGVLVAWVAVGEPVRAAQVGAFVAAAAGVALLVRSEHDHVHDHPALEHEHEHVHDDGHHDHEHDPPVPPGTRHSHPHAHEAVRHAHPHVPDLHHRHEH